MALQHARKRGASVTIIVDYEYVFAYGHGTVKIHCHERGKEFHREKAVTFRNIP